MSKTKAFGTGKRESHDASDYYARRMFIGETQPSIDKSDFYVDLPPDQLDRIHNTDAQNMLCKKLYRLPSNSVSLVVTSPPYSTGKDYDNDLSLSEWIKELEEVMACCWEVLEQGGRAVINLANIGRRPYMPLVAYTHMMMHNMGWLARAEIIWIKGQAQNNSCAWGSFKSARNPAIRDVHEYLLVYSKGRYDRIRKGESTISRDDFIYHTLSTWNVQPASAKRSKHPAPFPTKLIRQIIQLYSFKNDVILDPYMGSGTTAIAALQTDRHFIGYERSKQYVDLANERIEEFRKTGKDPRG